MHSIRWTKQQDFCLRAGLLKALVAVLPGQRQAVERSFVVERLGRSLFQPPSRVPSLVDAYRATVGSAPPPRATAADLLLATSGSASWGQPITLGAPPRTSPGAPARRTPEFNQKLAKVLEWGHAVGLLGRGNQLTERGLLLRGMFDQRCISRFGAGDPTAWNPFILSGRERAFFFFHLGESDELLWLLAHAVGEFAPGHVLETSAAHRLTAEHLADLVRRSSTTAPMTEMPRLRVLRELSSVISSEAGIANGPPTSAPRRGALGAASSRKTRKNADHQAIPRFEMLVDLGFLTKSVSPGADPDALLRSRSAWRFEVLPAAIAFRSAVGNVTELHATDWHWRSFGRAFGTTGIADGPTRPASRAESLAVFFDEFDHVQRRAGHTPFESAALLTVLEGLRRGIAIEIADLHATFLYMKQRGLFANQVSFAAGNEVDRMFLLLQPGAREAVLTWADEPSQLGDATSR